MSTPTRQFHKLSIGNMPETRSQSIRTVPTDQSEREDEGSEASGEESSGGESIDEITAPSGITYDMSNLDDESGASASVGFRSQFEVVNCRASDSGYEFQLLDRPKVHVGPDSTTCTCLTFQARPQAACQHIFWLLDQLHAYFHPAPSTARTALSSDGRPQVSTRVEELLNGASLQTVANDLQWQCHRDEGNGSHQGMTRTEKIRDVLSAFKTNILPEDFRPDLKETTQKLTAESCVVQGDFEATIFRLAVHDDSVFSSVCKAMPSGACASIYYEKIQNQSRRLLEEFDRYCATGERPTDPSSPGGGIVEVEEVVLQLRHTVSRIRSNIATRSPHGSEGAAGALVEILVELASRNKDPLAGNNWGRTSFHGEDEDQRNLYHLLFGSDDDDVKLDAELFVLSALEDLHPSFLTIWAQDLQKCLSKMEVNRAPKAYLVRLGTLIRSVEAAGAAGSSGAGYKRPAVGHPGGYSKRSR
ncbi:hypothetical protein N7520_009436 [Penicillium odoratum]|uniref:uncharacterized protein n=1 Tax=Penicillium odoratum TaxID=1167516 RepID=UPI002547DD9B|nr:uncharacterized protein N7520_009436 [Penicillium odoratum]KAJ5752519.1 hypothetical protein N7520_009436 [Penicillium odoratum]